MSKFYRTADELPADCLYDLKDRIFYGLDGKDPLIDIFECAAEIPDEIVFRRYRGKTFSPDDFWDDGGDWGDSGSLFTFSSFTDMEAPLDAMNNWLTVFAN